MEDSERLGHNAPERAGRACFLGASGKFVGFLDRLIASQRVSRDGIVVDRAISGQDELNKFLQEYMEDQIATVARDRSLTNPEEDRLLSRYPRLCEGRRVGLL